MDTLPVAEFSASDLKQSGPVLDAAMQGLVVIKRQDEQFVLLRQEEFDRLTHEVADRSPKTLEDLLVGYDVAEMRELLRDWNNDPPVGKELL